MPGIRTPSKILELSGAYKKHPERRRPAEPVAATIKKTAPKHLDVDQKKVWRELLKLLAPGVLQQSDRILLEQACVLVAEWRADPAEFKTSRHQLMLSCLARLGMTPADRARVSVVTPKISKYDRSGGGR